MPSEQSVVTIKTLLGKLSGWVEREESHSPVEWLDEANKLATLKLDLLDELAKIEVMYEQLIVNIQEQHRTETGKLMARSNAESRAIVDLQQISDTNKMTVYRYKRYLENRLITVDSIVQIAKKRSETHF